MYIELIVYVEHTGGGVVTAVISEMTSQFQGEFCKLAEISTTEKLLSAIVLSVNQEINKTGTLPHGITEVAISANLEIQQNWNFTTWHLWVC